MPDFRVADTAPEHPKLRAAGLAAFGLWAAAGAYSMRELTDGWVPAYWVATWPGGKRTANALISVGLWSEESRSGLPGYQFHDWEDYQRSAKQIHDERAEGRERARRSRERSKIGSPERSANVRDESHDSRALTRALTPEGSSRGGTSSSEREGSQAPRPRCSTHSQLPADADVPPCRACKQLRLDGERLVADTVLGELAARTARRAAIDACRLCDDNGMRETDTGVARCSHPTRLEVVS